MLKRVFLLIIIAFAHVTASIAQHSPDTAYMQSQPATHQSKHDHIDHHSTGCDHTEHEYQPANVAIHHISDANVYSILDAVHIPLPMFLYSKESGWDVFSSSKFHPGHHEDGHMAYNRYAMHHGSVHRITDATFPSGEQTIDCFTKEAAVVDGKEKDIVYAISGGKKYAVESRSTLDGGILGGGITSFYDFSITKNVLSMMLVCLFLFFMLRAAANYYKKNSDKAPKGVASFVEPIVMFLRDEVAVPFIGKEKYKKYFPMLLSIFFFILGLNLFGQVPFLGSTNVTGNITVTMILAVLVFIVVNINGNKDYWKHILWMPGVPTGVKPLLSVIEIASLFIKPLTLMLRLAGNISAGHVAILSFIGLIFVFGKSGQNMLGAGIGTGLAVPLTLFMMAIELLVAFLQAYVFTLLAASYIGAATEEHHHAEEHH